MIRPLFLVLLASGAPLALPLRAPDTAASQHGALAVDRRNEAVLQVWCDQPFRCVGTAPPARTIEPVKPVLAGGTPVVQLASAAQLKPVDGRVFRDALKDGTSAPELVVLPAGSFRMGSPVREAGHQPDEELHRVAIARFALGKYEVTVGQFRQFARASGYRTDAERNSAVDGKTAEGCDTTKGGTEFGWVAGTSWKQPGFAQSDNHPAVCLSYHDAQAYVEWLSVQTGKRYRLPSEAEQEYAIRAGSSSPYAWGTDVDQACRYANVSDASARKRFPEWSAVDCDDGAVFTVEVGRYSANGYGLHDTMGNAIEWSNDCFHDSYAGAPNDGSSWIVKGCDAHVLRGEGWGIEPERLRAAFRERFAPADRLSSTGLRVARDLD